MMLALMPAARNTLKILEPMRLPSAKSGSRLYAAMPEATSSGTLVPKATTVSPMMWSLTPLLMAMRRAPSTNHSEP